MFLSLFCQGRAKSTPAILAESVQVATRGRTPRSSRGGRRRSAGPPTGHTALLPRSVLKLHASGDNTANQRVASGAAVPSRSKHFLRRYHVLLQRVRSQEITIGHVPDRAMPADFLTKWIGASKLNVSVEHVSRTADMRLSDLPSNPRVDWGECWTDA